MAEPTTTKDPNALATFLSEQGLEALAPRLSGLTLDACIEQCFGDGRVAFLRMLQSRGLLPPERSGLANALRRAFRSGDVRVQVKADAARRTAFSKRVASGWTPRMLRGTFENSDLLDAAMQTAQHLMVEQHHDEMLEQCSDVDHVHGAANANSAAAATPLLGTSGEDRTAYVPVDTTTPSVPPSLAATVSSVESPSISPSLAPRTAVPSNVLALLKAARVPNERALTLARKLVCAGGLARLAQAAHTGGAKRVDGCLRSAGLCRLGERLRLTNAILATARSGGARRVLQVDHGTSYVLPLPRGHGEAARPDAILEALQRNQHKAQRSFLFAQQLMNLVTQMAVHIYAPDQPPVPMPAPPVPFEEVLTAPQEVSARSPDATPTLVLLIAVHCASAVRLQKLRRCLASVRGQIGATAAIQAHQVPSTAPSAAALPAAQSGAVPCKTRGHSLRGSSLQTKPAIGPAASAALDAMNGGENCDAGEGEGDSIGSGCETDGNGIGDGGGGVSGGDSVDAAWKDDWPLTGGVYVSWSAETDELRDGVREALRTAAIPALHTFERRETWSQMQHLASLVRQVRCDLFDDAPTAGADASVAVSFADALDATARCTGAGRASIGAPRAADDDDDDDDDDDEGDEGAATHRVRASNVWVMFTDDDDILHPARCASYLAAVHAAPATIEAVSAAWVARPIVAETRVASAGDVSSLVAEGRVVRTPKEGSEKKGGGGSWDEVPPPPAVVDGRGWTCCTCPRPLRWSLRPIGTLHHTLTCSLPSVLAASRLTPSLMPSHAHLGIRSTGTRACALTYSSASS